MAALTDKIKFTGLTDTQVAESRARHGVNVMTPPPRKPLWRRFIEKFRDPLIIVLMIAGVLSVGISCYEHWYLGQGDGVFFEPVGIFIAILLATGLSFIFEVKAEREFSVLTQVNDDEPVEVIRNGRPTSVPRRDIVVGDIVLLGTGAEVPADGRLLEAVMMSVDESTLTGEPLARKTTDPAQFDPDATYPGDCVMRGTKLMDGHGIMEVTAVGDATENGHVMEAAMIDNSVRTPLDVQLGRLGHMITVMSYVIGAAVIVGRVTMYFIDEPAPDLMGFVAYLLQSVMIAVTLIVVSVPEGLPMAVTMALSLSMRRMLKTNNLVRRLHACETMGAATVICTDKTGTLTRNRMQVYETQWFGHPDNDVIGEGIAVNSTAELETGTDGSAGVLGNPTEGALLLWLHERGISYSDLRLKADRVAELPFSTERKYMATTVRLPRTGRNIIYVKGAPEIVYGLCGDTAGVGASDLDTKLGIYQRMAMRTLALAYAELPEGETGIVDNTVTVPLTLLGIVAISDPVRDDVPDAVAEVLDAGIKVKIVTGDTVGTAREIGRQVGLWNDASDGDANIITGPEFAALSDEEVLERVDGLKIIARARPMDKKRLVEALQKRGEVVAVTGDGTNDAPALKAAHVGLSMGDGTAVAKEASDITIIDNSFASIGRAVMWGRSLYRNIQRFILFQMTVNVAACLVVLAGSFMGMQPPLTVTQMLWVNLIMDTFAAMALASLPPDISVMRDRPRDRHAFIISPAMWRFILGVGLTFAAVLLVMLYFLEHASIESLTDICPAAVCGFKYMSAYEVSLFFTVFVFLQFWNMFNAKAFGTGGRSALHLRGCSGFNFIVLCILVGQIAIVELGGPFFSVTPLGLADWLVIIGATSLTLWAGEIVRAIRRA